MFRFLGALLYYIFLIVLPFIVLVRLAVYVYEHYAVNGWVALGISGGTTVVLMIVYFSIMYSRFTGKLGTWMGLKRRAYAAGFLVFVFIAYALFFISGENVKHDAIRSEFHQLHPLLRMGVSTLLLIDKNLFITDAARQPEDYKKMGLTKPSHSLHYRQLDGYVHALDIRTKNRPPWANQAVQVYFRLMGFNTLRHGGTADHLHVSLMVHSRPYAR